MRVADGKAKQRNQAGTNSSNDFHFVLPHVIVRKAYRNFVAALALPLATNGNLDPSP